jgi:transposase-like protein
VVEPVAALLKNDNPYIAARSPLMDEVKQQAVAEAIHSGKVAAAADRHGISRATMYRLLKK